jgi:hypothetical protein
MKRIIILFLLVMLVAFPVQAQGEEPYIIRTTKPISEELRAALNAWLATDPPSDAPYYIVTYSKNKPTYTIVSLLGVDLPSPDAEWNLSDNTAVWMGTVKVQEGEVSPLTAEPYAPKLASPRAAGGGSYVAFPWQAGTSVAYGPRGVHGDGDYGTSGLLAVDLVSGTGFGPSAANDGVYASDDGTVDYVCEDDTTVAVRTHNEDTGDYFVYAHMLSNESLDYDVEFSKGELMGQLKHGSFDDTCGWAEQNATSWHVHWMFQPEGGSFRAEDCRLTVSSERWDCNGNEVGTGEFIYGGGGAGSLDASGLGTASGSVADTQLSFWDYFLGAIIGVVDILFFRQLPEHGSSEIIYVMYNAIEVVFRIARVLVFQNINIYPLVAATLYAIGINLLFGIGWLAAFLLKAWKSLVPILGS